MEQSIIFRIIILVLAYLIGSISPSYLIAKHFYGFDIREKGSGNAGTTNAYRTMGKKVALITLLVDILKGALAAYIGLKTLGREFAPFTGFMAVIGHNFPFYLDFRGGKGVATSIGMATVAAPKVLAFCAAIALPVLFITKIVSAASITAFIVLLLLSIYLMITDGPMYLIIVFVPLAVLNLYRHRSNIKRILNGTENKIGKDKK